MNEETLFDLLRNTPEAQRPALLELHCADNPALRARVEALLQADEQTLGYLTRQNDPHGTKSHHEPIGATGQIVAGKYKLIDNIGEGGMGSVWRAQQSEPVKRLVAVKLIKAGMDSKAVLARFEAERQALAVMDHPNIAKILDGGLHENRPYFVMELVKGVPITTYCDACKLNPKERLELFLPVCGAIQHAHMKGIIHRDIKPSNVIVALYDDKPIPKVIDFGIAKATGGGLTDASYMTAFGGVVGTPQYMSPEQASLNNLDIDTRSDVYSLGVLLYELLAGSPPFARQELEKAGLLEILRVVREEEPIRPSAKLSTAAALPTLSANRATDPKQLTGLMRNELDCIVMKSLEKDRTRRYESANSFAADVSRYLAGEAVQAVPPSVGYRMKKWVRKNRGLVLASGLVVGTLSVGVVGTTFGLLRAEAEANRANQEAINANAARATAERNLVQGYLRPIGNNTNGLDQAEQVALDELARQEDDRIKLLFLQEALKDGDIALRVARRSQHVIQAAVGPSLKRRSKALELVSAKQRDQSVDARVRFCACWLAIELGSDDLPAFREGFETLLARKVPDWNNFVSRLPSVIQPGKDIPFADALVTVLVNSKDENATRTVAETLVALAPHIDQANASRQANTLVDLLSNTMDSSLLRLASEALVALAPSLDTTSARRITGALVTLLDNSANEDVRSAASVSISALRILDYAPLEKQKLPEQVDVLVDVLTKSSSPSVSNPTGERLIKLAPKLDYALAEKGFNAFSKVVSITNVGGSLRVAVNGQAALALRLEPKIANDKISQAIDALLQIISTSNQVTALTESGNGLVGFALIADAKLAQNCARKLIDVLKSREEPNAKNAAIVALTAVAPRLDQALSLEVFDVVVAQLANPKRGTKLNSSAMALAAVAPRLDPTTTKTAADALVNILNTSKESNALYAAGQGLTALAPRLDPATTKTTADALILILNTSKESNAQSAAGEGLTALAPKLDPDTTKTAWNALVNILNTSKESNALYAAGQGLTALAPKLDTATIKTAWDALINILNTSKDFGALRIAGDCLTALAPKLDTATTKTAADGLINILKTSQESNALYAAGNGLTALAPKLDLATTKTAWDALINILNTSKDFGALRIAGDCLTALAPKLDTATTKTAADGLINILKTSQESNALYAAGNGLIVLAPKLDPTEVHGVFTKCLLQFAQSTDGNAQILNWSVMSTMAPLLKKSQRASSCEAACHVLLEYERRAKVVGLSYDDFDSGNVYLESRDVYRLLQHSVSIPFLAELLKEPACIGSNLDAILNRLDELAYPDAAYNAATSTDSPAFATVLGGTPAPLMQEARHRSRKLRTMHDAALWLQQHHPEINLDKPYAKTGK